MLNGSTPSWLPDSLPLGVVAKVVSTLVAVMLAYGALQGEIKVLQTEIEHLKATTQRIEQKLDRIPQYGPPSR